MDKYSIVAPQSRGVIIERLGELYLNVGDYLDLERLEGRYMQYSKIFLSDAQNQYDELIDSVLYQEILSKSANTIVEQPPLDGSKISVLIKTSDAAGDFFFQSMRLTDEETRGKNSYIQTIQLFDRYMKSLQKRGLSIKEHCVRTWIYVADIDVNYEGMVKARNDIFHQYGLTADTHFIASTGIGGYSHVRNASVAIDFLTYPDIKECDKTYLKALGNLNPTHEYGVSFERGTSLKHNDHQTIFISGTASIDNTGAVVYPGDVIRQAGRLLENIGALLKDGGATMNDIGYFIVYLRDLSDYVSIARFMGMAYPAIPCIIVEAKVCRPEWLIEMECVAIPLSNALAKGTAI